MTDEVKRDDSEMSVQELIEDFAQGLMSYVDEEEDRRRKDQGDNYVDLGEQIEYDVMFSSIESLHNAIKNRKDALTSLTNWQGKDRWCVDTLISGVRIMLEGECFCNWSFDDEEDESKCNDDYDCFVSWIDLS
ncbi:hypothetical protein OAV45_00255 [Candidatus Poseidoniales archaeon]|nr:hypothetical protein [Candidatus Poseidoniales archaeon]